ncbi:PREDICTED: 39S ribosomal protein L30, mitochondrial [Nicrophorus vespilloides]|uniref:Large ribosomal subunit protein uL30m n=1 Tax=Nicrophorus vespilloides TaxID=110193 RepID=A0ABM1MCJ1_NICVS|nr:PREDICTED: 39S ribosomal protein L30, mitochondrial [Nicrophorus vespilloides]
MSNLLKPSQQVLQLISRGIGRNRGKTVYKWEGEGIKYDGFTYYPRHADFQDPPYEPTKLFRVQRIKPLKGTSYWEKDHLKQLGLLGKCSEVNIVKNIPENQSRLWKVKHLIKITPITFPNGFPEDVNGTFLKENGELVVNKKLLNSEDRLVAREQFDEDPQKLDGDTLRRDSRIKWLSGW